MVNSASLKILLEAIKLKYYNNQITPLGEQAYIDYVRICLLGIEFLGVESQVSSNNLIQKKIEGEGVDRTIIFLGYDFLE